MLQRHHRVTLEKVLSSARQRLQSDFQTLRNSDLRQVELYRTAELILDMYSNIHNPITSLKVIKQNFESMKHPHFLQLEMIMDKAEMFYIESVTHDLTKLKEQQRIMTLTQDDIKDYIQQINWKNGYDRQSILNESQEIGDNIDLMKFFEGVRNYQNWEETLEKQCIEKLKRFSNETENQLTFKKGFMTAKLESILSNYQRTSAHQLFAKVRKETDLNKKLQVFKRIMKKKSKDAFEKIKLSLYSKSDVQKLKELFTQVYHTSSKKALLDFCRKIRQRNARISHFCLIFTKIKNKKMLQAQSQLFHRLFGKRQDKILALGTAFEKISHTLKKISVKKIGISLGLPLLNICYIINKAYERTLVLSYESIRCEEKPKGPVLSQKLKGKVLMSLQKHERKPVDLRKTFLSWYLKGHQQKYAKMIYNIYLQGNTSKFTFFMRIKNSIYESRKMKIKPELKMFLLVLMQKMNGYYNYSQKKFINQWHSRHKYCKKLESVIKSLFHLEILVNKKCERYALEGIKHQVVRRKFISKYISKRITNYSVNLQSLMRKWKTIPNIKKSKGRLDLLKKLRSRLVQNDNELRKTFYSFSNHKNEGKKIKVGFLSKMFAKDLVYLSAFFNYWRTNARSRKNQDQMKMQAQDMMKRKGISGILEQLKRRQTKDIQNCLIKFEKMGKFGESRKKYLAKNLRSFIFFVDQGNKHDSFSAFADNFREGIKKKNQLVCNLVNANKIKQVEVFTFLKTHNFTQIQQQKKQRVLEIFTRSHNSIKDTANLLFEETTILKVLQKIVTNYPKNISTTFMTMKNLPLRINWKKKGNAIELFSKLSHLVQKDKMGVLKSFKSNHSEGQFKKKKILDVMTYNYIDCSKTYFKKYLNEIREQKLKQKHLILSKNFDDIFEATSGSFQILFQGEKVWGRKMEHLKKLQVRIKDKMKQAMRLWHSGAKTMSYYNQINNEKKKRLLGFISQILKKNSFTESKNMIQMFHKNSKITQIQTKFLNKLCDSQAGKVIKAMMIWKNLPKPANKELISKASKFQGGLYHFANKIIRFSFSRFKDEHYMGNDRKKIAIRKLVARSCSGIDKYFTIWKENNSLITIFSKCHKATYLFEQIAKIQAQQISLLLNGQISKEVSEKFLKIENWWKNKKRLAYNKWRKNTKEMIKMDKIKKKKLLSLVEIDRNVERKKVKETIRKVKTLSFLRKVIASYFVQRQKINVYEGLLKIRNVPDLKKQQLLELNQLKKQALNHLFKSIEQKEKGYIDLWRMNVKEIKFNEHIVNSNKKAILEKINSLISGSSQGKVKESIKLFYRNFKVTKVQKKFIERLLQTKSGKMVEAFCIWRDLPNQNMMEKYKKGQKFFFKLEGLLKQKQKEAHKQFTENNEQGSTIKKQAVIKLLDITSNGMRRYYNRWDTMTRRNKTLQQANKTLKSLETIHMSLYNSYQIIFADQRSVKIKTWAIERLIQTSSNSFGRYFNKWRQIVREQKVAEALLKDKKTEALKLFTNVIGNSEQAQAKEIVLKFRKNLHITKISRNFLGKLLRTKSGKVMQLFEIWKNLPSAKMAAKKKRAIKFESNLHKMSNKFLKRVFDPFKTESYVGNNKKKYCIERLIRASMGEEKRKFLLWRQIVKEEKMLVHVHLFDSLFQNMKGLVSDNIGLMLRDTKKEITQKKSLCRKLINNSNFVQHHAYFVWKEALQTDNVKIEKQEGVVKVNLLNLINVEEKKTMKQLVEVISKFKAKHGAKQSELNASKKEAKNRKVIKFHERLSKFSDQRISTFVKILTKEYTQSHLIKKNRSTQNSFQNLHMALSENFKIMMRSNRETVIIEKALNKLFSNIGGSLSKLFNIWKENKNILKMQSAMSDEKKKNILSILNKMLNQKAKSEIPLAVKKFEKNFKTTKLMKEILVKICQCKAGKVPLAFMVWKALPNPGAKKMRQKASKFESGLARLCFKKLKGTYEKFKQDQFQGNVKKKYAVNKLILVTMSDSNRTFNKWRKVANEQKITEKMILLQGCFEKGTDTIRQNNIIFENPFEQNSRKVNSLKQIIKSTTTNMSEILRIWKNNIKNDKCYAIDKVLTKYDAEYMNKASMKESFEKIKKKADMEMLRAYINSLWKWKMSNVEANYYAKFIKVFKESEQLLIFSNVFNKKRYENLHHSFRAILSQGTERQQRKYQIVEKYLTRRLSNYFQRFKLNACFEEIKTWRNIYKEAIKGKRLLELIERFSRKQLKDSLEQINYLSNLKLNTHSLVESLNELQNKFKKQAILRMKDAGYRRFTERLEDAFCNVEYQRYQHAFILIKKTNSVSFLKQKIRKILEKYLKKQAFDKIGLKSHRVAHYRLALKFLSYAQEKSRNSHTINVVRSFKKVSDKAHALRNISNMLSNKQIENMKFIFKSEKQAKGQILLLSRFMKGMKIKKILDKQDKKLMRNTLQKMKKKENKWMSDSIKRFVARSNIKSSMAVSMWRLKNFSRGNQV